MIKCCISSFTVYSIPLYTNLSNQKLENMKFKEKNKIKLCTTYPVTLYYLLCNFM